MKGTLLLATLAAASLLGACDGNPSGPEDGTMSRNEVERLLNAGPGDPNNGWQESHTVTQDGNWLVWSIGVVCPLGGGVQVDFRDSTLVTTEPSGFSVYAHGTHRMNGCSWHDDVTGEVAVRTQNVEFQTYVTAVNREVDGSPTAVSEFERRIYKGWSTLQLGDGPAVRCEDDYESVYQRSSKTITIRGLYCGRQVDMTRAADLP